MPKATVTHSTIFTTLSIVSYSRFGWSYYLFYS